jgi:hypothetical protein
MGGIVIAKVYLSRQSAVIVKQLLSTGLYGSSLSEVCERLVYEKLREFVDVPKLRLERER